ncbi:MAG: 30S ribosomal protein S3 [Patescibacteria group bacterium]|nr:30S ribosomal protein S3 [Patescibacteria group bacterium]
MGHKVNPIVFRMGMSQSWKSKWFSDKNYIEYLKQDVLVRKFLKNKLKDAGIAEIEIKRSADIVEIVIHSSRPGVIIGRGGTGVEDIKKDITNKYFKNIKKNLKLTIEEVKRPMLSAPIVLQGMIDQIEKRLPYRKVMKKTIEKVMQAGARGVKITMSGRLNGVEIARTETLKQGRLPLHTLRADIDYSRGVARTTYGAIGIKIWIYKGEVIIGADKKEDKPEERRKFHKFENKSDKFTKRPQRKYQIRKSESK